MVSFIVNRNARDGQSQQNWQLAEPMFKQAFPQAQIFYPDSQEETIATARRLADVSGSTIVSVGGEGTMNRVMQGIMQSENADKVTMGVVPFGNVNDYTTNLGMRKNWQHALEVLQAGKIQRVGLVQLKTNSKNEFALNIADLGIGASTAQRHLRGELRWLKGRFKYNLLALKSLMSWQNVPATIEVDGQTMDVPVGIILAGYSPTLGGFELLPHGRVDDPKMAVTIAHSLSRLEMVNLMQDAKKRRFKESDRVHFLNASRLTLRAQRPVVAQVDGEITDASALSLELIAHPRRLNFVVP